MIQIPDLGVDRMLVDEICVRIEAWIVSQFFLSPSTFLWLDSDWSSASSSYASTQRLGMRGIAYVDVARAW